MANPMTHARSAARKWGGKPEDYYEIHAFMDSTTAAFPDNRHRAITHNAWFISQVLPRVFGHYITNSDGKEIPVLDIGRQHCTEDHSKSIPTLQDWLSRIPMEDWMNGLGRAPSAANLVHIDQLRGKEYKG